MFESNKLPSLADSHRGASIHVMLNLFQHLRQTLKQVRGDVCKFQTVSGLTIAMLALVCVCGPCAVAATSIDGKPNNPYGVMVGMWGGDWSDYASIHFQWARDLVGEWGYVRVNSGINDLNTDGAIRTIAICRAKHLIPIFRGLYVPPEYRDPKGEDSAPLVRDDGYPAAAEHYRKWAAALAALGAVAPYYEFGNEINGKWKPDAYGGYLIALSKAVKQVMPGLKVTSAGLAGNGDEFVEKLLRSVPEVKNHVDCWGLHPYGINHPPAYEKDGNSLRGHLWTAAALRKFDVTNPRFVMTESGYEIGNKLDKNYPRITDELRAKYLVEAYETIWAPDPRVAALTIFMLQAGAFPGWDGWVLIDTNCNKSETYKALAAVPKPKGSDWMPQGNCSISGRITDIDSKQGLERVFVYTVPGIYAAETDDSGNYRIDNVPAGAYEIRVFRDGFTAPQPGRSRPSAHRPGRYDAAMKRVGFLTAGTSKSDRVIGGWIGVDGKPDEHYAVDTGVTRTRIASQRLTAKPGSPPGIWQCTGHVTAVPDRAMAAEVWVKGSGVRLGRGKGAVLSLSITDGNAQALSTAEVNLPLEGDFDWTPIDVTIPPYPPGRRLQVVCKFDAEAGTVWFADPYCHYAEYPVPSRSAAAGGGVVKGFVKGENGEFLADAVVFTRPGNYWTTTRSDGSYVLSGLPAGTYDLWAFRRDWAASAKRGVTVSGATATGVDLLLAYVPVASEVQNPGFEKLGPGKEYTIGWHRYGEFDGLVKSGWHPEVPEHPSGIQAHSGNAFAGSIAAWNVKNGGLYQTISAAPGKTYEVSVYSYTYQTPEGIQGDVANRLGIDPTGGDDPNGPYVIWTPYRPSQKAWTRVSLTAEPVGSRVTIFLDAKQVQGLGFCLNCFDDVSVNAGP
jgi:hypothetical protein